MMTQDRRADVCYDFDADTHSKCRIMNSVSLAIKKENTSELRFKKTVKNLILNSCSHAEYDECTS